MHASLLSFIVLLGANDPTTVETNDFDWVEPFANVEAWSQRPSWLSNPSNSASLVSDGRAACFHVPAPSRGMKWARPLPALRLDRHPYLAVRYRAEHLDTARSDYFIYLDDRRPDGDFGPIRLSDVKSDGRWHTVAVELSGLTKAEMVHSAAVHVQASKEGETRVWIDWITLCEALPEGAELLQRGPQAPPIPDWQLPLERAAWTPQPSWLSNPAPPDRSDSEQRDDSRRFKVLNPGRGMKWSWQLPQPIEPQRWRWLVLEYRASHLSPQGEYMLGVVGRKRSGEYGYTSVVAPRELASDGIRHVLETDLRAMAKDFAAIDGLAVQVQADSSAASLDVFSLRLTNAQCTRTLSQTVALREGATFPSHRAVELPASPRASTLAWKNHLRLADWFSQGHLTAQGIPFALTGNPMELAATRVAQRGELRFPCDAAASEVYLLLLAALEGEEEAPFGGGPFAVIRDVDRFRLRLEYADGTRDECLPMNVATKRFEIVRGPQVIVAAADPAKRLQAIIVCDDCRQAAFAVVAATVRMARDRSLPEALEDQPPLRAPRGGEKPQAVAVFDGSERVVLHQWIVRPSQWNLLQKPASLISLRVDGKDIAFADFMRETNWNDQADKKAAGYRIASAPGLALVLSLREESESTLRIEARIENRGQKNYRVALVAPRIDGYQLGPNAENAWYLLPKRGAAFDNRPCDYRERYCGLFPVQFIDTFDTTVGRGLTLHTIDTECREKYYRFSKSDRGLSLGVEYPERTLAPGESFQAAPAILAVTDGDWRRGFEAYRTWVRTWHRPRAPRKAWFREVFNFRQRFLTWLDPLEDAKTGRIDLARAVEEARREFGGIDYLHLFDWGNCGPYGRIYGRTGDFSPYDYLKGGRDGLRAAIAGVQAGGVPVGLYIEGYLLSGLGKLGQGPGKAWQMIGADGSRRSWPNSTEMYVCSFVPAWREVQASTYATKAKELGVDGMYLDEFGFAGSEMDCWSASHGHGRPGYAAIGERDCTRMVRERIDGAKSGVALYSEETPVDVTTQYQDGSFTYAMSSAASTTTRVPLNLTRFALPDFKTIEILYCDKPTGSWATGVKWVFFNGEAIWLEGPALEWFEPRTRAAIRRCHAILRAHRDAFTTLNPSPLLPTEIGGVFANAFPVPGKTVYTFYNSRHRTIRGAVLRAPRAHGVTWHDAWRDRPAEIRDEGDSAVVRLEIGPNDVGCVVAQQQASRSN